MTTPPVPRTPAASVYAAALRRAQAAHLTVTPVWDPHHLRTCWRVVSDHSTHMVRYQPETNVLVCDCDSRVYCRCRAAVHEYLVAEAARTALRLDTARAHADARDAALLSRPSHAISAFS
jgi:hypothetical protein